MYMTTAVDLVITEVEEPVRFLLETRVRVCSPTDRLFWPFSRRSFTETFYLKLRQVAAARRSRSSLFRPFSDAPFSAAQMERKERKSPASDTLYEVVSLESESERERRKTTASPGVPTGPGAAVPSPPEDDEEEGDAPLFPFFPDSLTAGAPRSRNNDADVCVQTTTSRCSAGRETSPKSAPRRSWRRGETCCPSGETLVPPENLIRIIPAPV